MTTEKKLATYQLSPEHVELCRKAKQFQEEIETKIQALYDQVEADRSELIAEINTKAKEMWDQVAPAHGLDSDTTFSSGQYILDFQYMDLGLVFINEREVSQQEKLMRMPAQGTA